MPIKKEWKLFFTISFLLTGVIFLFTPFYENKMVFEERFQIGYSMHSFKNYRITFGSRPFNQNITVRWEAEEVNFSFFVLTQSQYYELTDRIFEGDQNINLENVQSIVSRVNVSSLNEKIKLNSSYQVINLLFLELELETRYAVKISYEYYFYYTNYGIFFLSVGLILSIFYLYQYLSVIREKI